MQPRGLGARRILISMQCRFVLTNWRSRGDRAGLMRPGAVSDSASDTHTHTHNPLHTYSLTPAAARHAARGALVQQLPLWGARDAASVQPTAGNSLLQY